MQKSLTDLLNLEYRKLNIINCTKNCFSSDLILLILKICEINTEKKFRECYYKNDVKKAQETQAADKHVLRLR